MAAYIKSNAIKPHYVLIISRHSRVSAPIRIEVMACARTTIPDPAAKVPLLLHLTGCEALAEWQHKTAAA
jgi:hypothetical protein